MRGCKLKLRLEVVLDLWKSSLRYGLVVQVGNVQAALAEGDFGNQQPARDKRDKLEGSLLGKVRLPVDVQATAMRGRRAMRAAEVIGMLQVPKGSFRKVML